MSNGIANRTITSHYVIKSKWLPQFYSYVCNFCAKERTLCIIAVLLRTGLQQTYRPTYTYKQTQEFCKFMWRKKSPALLAQLWRL